MFAHNDPPQPSFNNEIVPQYVQYHQEYPYLEGLNQVEILNPPYISSPNKEPFYMLNFHPFNLPPHHHFEDHDVVRLSNPPPQQFNHQQFQQVLDDDQLKIDQQFQSAFPTDCIPVVVKRALGKNDAFTGIESNLEISIVKNRPLSLDPQLNTPFKKFTTRDEDILKGEKIIFIEDESSESESENESEVSSIKLQDPSFVIEPGEVYVIDDSEEEDQVPLTEGQDGGNELEEVDENKRGSDEESDHLISDHNSIIQDKTLPTQPKSPEHIKSSLEADQHTAKTHLYHWSFIFQYNPKEELTVSILGKTHPDGNRNFTTSPIVHRINSNTILTLNGTKYVLTSSFDNSRNQDNNIHISAVFLKQFSTSLDGPFPKNWRELIEKEFVRLEETTESSNRFVTENNFDYQIGGLDESSLKEDIEETNEEPKKINQSNKRKSKTFEEELSLQKSPIKRNSSSKKRRKRYDTSSDEEESEEYVELKLAVKKPKRKSVQTSILNSFTKESDSISLTDELKSTMLSWKRRPTLTSKIIEPTKEIELSHLSPEKIEHSEKIVEHSQINDFFNEIGGLSEEEDTTRGKMLSNDVQDPEPTPPKKRKSRKSRKSEISNFVVDTDLNESLPQVDLPTQFAPKSKRKQKVRNVSLYTIEKAWFGDLE